MSDKLLNIANLIKSKYSAKLKDFTYICPDDRKFIESGNSIKYININDPKQKLKSGTVVNLTKNQILLKSLNSSITWTIKMTECHIFYKFHKDNLIDAINDLFEKI
jgi:hypothetical protein